MHAILCRMCIVSNLFSYDRLNSINGKHHMKEHHLMFFKDRPEDHIVYTFQGNVTSWYFPLMLSCTSLPNMWFGLSIGISRQIQQCATICSLR